VVIDRELYAEAVGLPCDAAAAQADAAVPEAKYRGGLSDPAWHDLALDGLVNSQAAAWYLH
jgi:hypothetical protein